MATFKPEIIKSQRKQDGTWNVKIRVIHNGEVKRISTPWYVTKDGITKGFKIKDQSVLDAVGKTIVTYRERFMELGIGATTMSLNEVVNCITEEKKCDSISFFNFADEYVKTKGEGKGVYITAKNSFRKYLKDKDIAFTDINSKIIRGWYESMTKKSANDSFSALRSIFAAGKKEYNDEENGRIAIPNNPFANIELRKREQAEKSAISVEAVRMIARIENEARHNSCRNRARDFFILSFCLMGMNAADIYDVRGKIMNGRICYQRKKTRNRRGDKAYIEVEIPDRANDIIERYLDVTEERIFRVHRMFYSTSAFNTMLADGMRKIKQELIRMYREEHKGETLTNDEIIGRLDISNLRFYSARHSWATVARNECGVDKWTVHEGLNHVDSATKITDVYIRKDFSAINEANKKVVKYVFGKHKL